MMHEIRLGDIIDIKSTTDVKRVYVVDVFVIDTSAGPETKIVLQFVDGSSAGQMGPSTLLGLLKGGAAEKVKG